MQTEAVIITCCIYTVEGWDISIADVPGDFLSANMDEDVYMLIDGPLAEVIKWVCPKAYKNYVFKNKRRTSML